MNSIFRWILNHWLTQEKFWIAVGSIITAVALAYTITRNIRTHRHGIGNLKSALKIELTTNIDSLFSGGVDRPLLFDAMKLLRRQYTNDVKDRHVLGQLQRLYLELQDYDRFIQKTYLTTLPGKYATERQLQKCNTFLDYFGHDQIEYNPARLLLSSADSYIQGARDDAIRVKAENFDRWYEKVCLNIDELLDDKPFYEARKNLSKLSRLIRAKAIEPGKHVTRKIIKTKTGVK